MAVQFNQIVPWGRSRREYELMFDLAGADLSRGVLDCGGGPASFAAESLNSGPRVVSADPIYAFTGAEIRARFDAIADSMITQVRATPDDWNWSYHGSPEGLLANRRAALESFLKDYEQGARERRYLAGELPSLPFESRSFGVAVCSHLLFLYSEILDEDFHVRAATELCRVADDVRMFPLLTLRREPSPHLNAVRRAAEAAGWKSEVVTVDYEFQRGGNQMLRLFKPQP